MILFHPFLTWGDVPEAAAGGGGGDPVSTAVFAKVMKPGAGRASLWARRFDINDNTRLITAGRLQDDA